MLDGFVIYGLRTGVPKPGLVVAHTYCTLYIVPYMIHNNYLNKLNIQQPNVIGFLPTRLHLAYIFSIDGTLYLWWEGSDKKNLKTATELYFTSQNWKFSRHRIIVHNSAVLSAWPFWLFVGLLIHCSEISIPVCGKIKYHHRYMYFAYFEN